MYKREDFEIGGSMTRSDVYVLYSPTFRHLGVNGELRDLVNTSGWDTSDFYFPSKQEAEESITKFLSKQKGITNQEIIAFLEKVKINLEEWGQYANTYFQQKYDLNGDIKEIDDFIEKLRGTKEGM